MEIDLDKISKEDLLRYLTRKVERLGKDYGVREMLQDIREFGNRKEVEGPWRTQWIK